MIKQTTSKYRSIIPVAILIFIAVAVWSYLYYLTNEANNRTLINEEGVLISHGSREETELLKAVLTSHRSQIELIKASFIDRNGAVDFIKQIETAAHQAGVTLKINQVEDKDTVSAGLLVEGSFSNLMQFLALIENSPFQLVFNRLDLNHSEKNWSAELSITLLSLKN